MTSLAAKHRMRVGATYLVDGVLHDYLGPALSPETGGLVHAFRRREWRPDTPDQLLVTLVAEDAIDVAVTRFGAEISTYRSRSPRQNGGHPLIRGAHAA